MWYQTELLARERQEKLIREAAEMRLLRLAGCRPRLPAKPARGRFFGRG